MKIDGRLDGGGRLSLFLAEVLPDHQIERAGHHAALEHRDDLGVVRGDSVHSANLDNHVALFGPTVSHERATVLDR